MLRGASGMLTGDLPLAFAGLSDATLEADLAASARVAAGEIDSFRGLVREREAAGGQWGLRRRP